MSETTPPGSWPGLGEHGESILGSDPLQTARDLQGALEGMTAQLAAVRKTVQRGKLVVIGLVIGLLIDVGLTVVVSITAVQAHNASVQASATVAQLRAVAMASCESGNRIRASEITFWEHLAAISTTTQTTPAQRKTDAQLLEFVRATFAPRPCKSLYRLHGGTS